ILHKLDMYYRRGFKSLDLGFKKFISVVESFVVAEALMNFLIILFINVISIFYTSNYFAKTRLLFNL
ncbi:MAG TPA: hypothetical protein VF941_18900, partial [Clostridia bacterium]